MRLGVLKLQRSAKIRQALACAAVVDSWLCLPQSAKGIIDHELQSGSRMCACPLTPYQR